MAANQTTHAVQARTGSRKPILDLDALIDRQIIRINGVDYALRANEELAPLTIQKAQKLGREIGKLVIADEADEPALKETPRALCRMVMVDSKGDPVSDEVLDLIGNERVWQICMLFTKQLTGTMPANVGEDRPEAPSVPEAPSNPSTGGS